MSKSRRTGAISARRRDLRKDSAHEQSLRVAPGQWIPHAGAGDQRKSGDRAWFEQRRDSRIRIDNGLASDFEVDRAAVCAHHRYLIARVHLGQAREYGVACPPVDVSIDQRVARLPRRGPKAVPGDVAKVLGDVHVSIRIESTRL